MADTGKVDRSGLIFGLYAVVIGLLLCAAGLFSFAWFFAATMASDGCHGDDARDICTLAGQQWAVRTPVITFIAGVLGALVPVPVVAACRWHAGWVWLGLPLAVGAYAAGPHIANMIRASGIW
ncbi:hypothetical protein I3U60_05275 [Mycobacteroides abscessus subsp. massiliense]|uniref:hypothetical protein n=1 Tax=Mycobacteroides abscessus TaxID=36809 RepID=UPI0019D03913|nr:hypothetical protein [Mycobacteroides abscessus]MBN7375692.1 hypothetical protein [Mycobacteroides abscessus subsp. massiliense]